MQSKTGRTNIVQERALQAGVAHVRKTRGRSCEAELGAIFRENGYCRTPSSQRRREGYETYKKGWEVRLVADDRAALTRIRKMLRKVHLAPGRPFKKGNKWVQPVYGREAVESFQQWAEPCD